MREKYDLDPLLKLIEYERTESDMRAGLVELVIALYSDEELTDEIERILRE